MITNTTLCYVDDGVSYLMLHRTKKAGDMNKDKWIGIGGHMEEGESPEDCILREAQEETGCRLVGLRLRGIITFCYRDITEYMFLFTAAGCVRTDRVTAAGAGEPGTEAVQADELRDAAGTLISEREFADCNEGDLVWVPKDEVPGLNLWEGDRIFLRLLAQEEPFFSLKLVYNADDTLREAVLNGEKHAV